MTEEADQSSEPLLEPLTRREREVLAILAEGYSAPEIADKLTLAVSSIKWHLQHVYGKLGVNSRRAAVTLSLDAPGKFAAVNIVVRAGSPLTTSNSTRGTIVEFFIHKSNCVHEPPMLKL